MEIAGLKRVFKLKKGGAVLTLPDPNPEFTADEVVSFYSTQYPELTTSNVSGPELKDGEAQYEFKTTVGTKG